MEITPFPSPAKDILLAEITASGPISFARFMEVALYHPEAGYYSTARAHIGKTGDFYTNISIGNIFARVLYTQFEDAWNALGRPSSFRFIEFGAHTGLFASDILQHAGAQGDSSFAQALEYHIVEPHPHLRARQEATLCSWPHRLHSQWEDLPFLPLEGMLFANELLDAFPFHLVEWTGSEWLERRIEAGENGNFQWLSTEIIDPFLISATRSIPMPLPAGYVTEVCPARQLWLRKICERFTRGVLLFIDYGYSRQEFFAPHRTCGTFACYHRHRRTEDPFSLIGEQDLTAHVEFTSFIEEAKHCGFSLAGFTDQHHFLAAAAEPWLRSVNDLPLDSALQSDLRRLQMLLHPAFMGTQFRVLALSRNLQPPVLSGFRTLLSSLPYIQNGHKNFINFFRA